MAKREIDLYQSSLPELDSILHNQSVSDLSWLNVDVDEYKAFSAVPKQNLDVIPELQKALLEDEDSGVPHLIPLKPHNIVNQNPLDKPQSVQRTHSDVIRNRVAKLVMSGMASKEIGEKLQLEFSPSDIGSASVQIKEVLSERGLIGNVYIDAKHFPLASRDPKERKLAQVLSKKAQFVIGGCVGSNGCNCHQTGYCKTFGGKRVVAEVPYGPNLIAQYAPGLAAEKRSVDVKSAVASNTREAWKAVLKLAFNAPVAASRPDGVRTVHQQDRHVPVQPSAQEVIDFWNRKISSDSIDPIPSATYTQYSRRMMAGYDDRQFLVASTEKDLRDLAGEYGILGHTYLDVDAIGGCRTALEFIKRKNSRPDFFIRRSANCSLCQGQADGACAELCKIGSIVTSKPTYDRQIFAFALRRASADGRISPNQIETAIGRAGDNSNWAKLTSEANLYKPAEVVQTDYQGLRLQAFYGSRGNELGHAELDPESVRLAIGHLMNIGLHGKALQAAILKQYSRSDLAQMPEVGRQASVDDGVQGTYFIDPTVYNDYGHGCETGSKSFHKRGPKNLLAAGSCTGCQLQTAPGWCTKYAKNLIRSVSEEVRIQIASKRSLPVVQPMVEQDPAYKYGLSNEIQVDMNGAKGRPLNIEIDGPSFDD